MSPVLSRFKYNVNKRSESSVLRKSKIFIKSRFSRNRQSCRPIVFWSIWVNILFITYTTNVFYGFKFSVGYSSWIIMFTTLAVTLTYLLRGSKKK